MSLCVTNNPVSGRHVRQNGRFAGGNDGVSLSGVDRLVGGTANGYSINFESRWRRESSNGLNLRSSRHWSCTAVAKRKGKNGSIFSSQQNTYESQNHTGMDSAMIANNLPRFPFIVAHCIPLSYQDGPTVQWGDSIPFELGWREGALDDVCRSMACRTQRRKRGTHSQ